MDNFFKNLPFNTSEIFVMVKDDSGCEIYVPARNEIEAKRFKDYLIHYLNKQSSSD